MKWVHCGDGVLEQLFNPEQFQLSGELRLYNQQILSSVGTFEKGHIGVTVDDTYKACERFERLGVEFSKKPDDGKMKGIAFIKDPDGYLIEIFDTKTIGDITSAAA